MGERKRADAESRRRVAAESRLEAAEVRLERMEAECVEARHHLRRAEMQVEEENTQRAKMEKQWEQRHSALGRQLRRTELALGKGSLSDFDSVANDTSIDMSRSPGDRNLPHSS